MPLYEYECDQNHHRFEVIQKFSDPLVQICPTCGSPVHKLMSSPAIQFKGTGWYVTDYARKGSGDAKPAKDAKSTKEGESKDSTESKESAESKDTKDAKSDTSTKTEAPAATSSPSTTKD